MRKGYQAYLLTGYIVMYISFENLIGHFIGMGAGALRDRVVKGACWGIGDILIKW